VPRAADEPADPREIVDPDLDLAAPGPPAETRQWDVLAAIAVGGVLGAEARYGVGQALPHTRDEFPWSTVLINVSGCLLIGVLMVVLLELLTPHRLARPLLGVGILGGYTTYSTFAVDVQHLLLAHRPGLALGYVAVTLALGALAVLAGTGATRWLAGRGAVR
jgi:CrcB protein